MRHDGRRPDELRPLEIVRRFTTAAPGSVLIRAGQTHVLCTATIDERVPEWRQASGLGWLTAEYDMLPGSTGRRRARNRADGRTQEIQRLIGRALRSAVNLTALGPRTIHLDCDVLQADGGTRTAAVTGAYVALCDAVSVGSASGLWGSGVVTTQVAAVSVGVVSGQVLMDLDYKEDAAAEVDCNAVMTSAGDWIEVQASAERAAFAENTLREMLAAARSGLEALFERQRNALAENAQ